MTRFVPQRLHPRLPVRDVPEADLLREIFP